MGFYSVRGQFVYANRVAFSMVADVRAERRDAAVSVWQRTGGV